MNEINKFEGYNLLLEAQRNGGFVCVIRHKDNERKGILRTLGFNTDEMMHVEGESLRQLKRIIERLKTSNEVKAILFINQKDHFYWEKE